MDLFKTASNLVKRGQAEEGTGSIARRLTARRFDGRGDGPCRPADPKAVQGSRERVRPLRVFLVGQFTTSWVATTLTAVAWSRNAAIEVSEGGYDTVLQDLAGLRTATERPDVIVLLPWNRRLFGGDAPALRVADELGLWKQAWSMVNGEQGSRLLQLGYDWITSGSLGSYLDGQAPGRIHAVRSINTEIRPCLPAGAYFLDMEQVSGAMGRDRFYDMRRYYWTRQPFSEEGTYRLATHLWAGICALTTGPKKALILDLDNTLWGGVVGETGPLGVALGDSPDGEAFPRSRPISKISHGGASSLPSPPKIIPGMPGKSSRRTVI